MRKAIFPLVAASLIAPGAMRAQEVAARAEPAIGDVAPDFALPGATRYGVLADPVRLSDYRGQTVVLAFFSQARTRG